MKPSTDARPLRADAERNRTRLMEAAVAAFAERGYEVTVAEIAREAGVGKGTVFRRFPTKEHLIAAVVRHRLAQLVAVGEDLLGRDDPWHALREFLFACASSLSADRCLVEFAVSNGMPDEQVQAVQAQLRGLAGELVGRAQRHGVLRGDVTGDDVLLLLCGVNQAVAPLSGVVPDLWKRYVDLVLDGLRPTAAHPLPVPPPDEDALSNWGTGSTARCRA
jgi:AcrR family transcriptional regulator